MQLFKKLVFILALSVMVGGFVGCKEKGPAEKAGEKIDESMEKAGEAMEEAGDKVEDAMDK